jgi:hypothetical protein
VRLSEVLEICRVRLVMVVLRGVADNGLIQVRVA